MIGLRALLNLFAAIVITGVHATLAYTNFFPVAPLVLLGVCYSVYASALWPSIALVIEPRFHATAYGVTTAVQNLGLAVGPLIVAKLMPASDCATWSECVAGWNNTELLFAGMGAAGVLAGVGLNIVDLCCGKSILNHGTRGCVCAPRSREEEAAKLLAEEEDESQDPLLSK